LEKRPINGCRVVVVVVVATAAVAVAIVVIVVVLLLRNVACFVVSSGVAQSVGR